ncbi:MAG TPA: hypothetical protein VHF51_07850 [Solirubrobacteraceae bacterium]|nr:hypothetical protein [Solirubrobacteraceae bacterium]
MDDARPVPHRGTAKVAPLARRLRKDPSASGEPGRVLDGLLPRTGA